MVLSVHRLVSRRLSNTVHKSATALLLFFTIASVADGIYMRANWCTVLQIDFTTTPVMIHYPEAVPFPCCDLSGIIINGCIILHPHHHSHEIVVL